jgi:Ca2+-binding RTX toxin-like protein
MATYTSTNGDDNFIGTPLADTFTLFAGDDTASGLAGNDTFIIQPYSALYPTLSIHAYGGDGDDIFDIQSANGGVYTANLTIDGGAGLNTAFLADGVYPTSTLSLINIQVLAVRDDPTISTETVNSVSELATWDGVDLVTQPTGTVSFTLSDAGTINLSTDIAAQTIVYGSDAGDVLIAGAGATDLYGGAGNDTLEGGSGIDVLHASAGQNIYTGGSATTSVDYSAAPVGVTVSLAASGFQNTGYSTDEISGVTTLIGSASQPNHLTASDQGSTLEVTGTYGASDQYYTPQVSRTMLETS